MHFQQYDYLNKIWTVTASTDMWMGVLDSHGAPPLDEKLQTISLL